PAPPPPAPPPADTDTTPPEWPAGSRLQASEVHTRRVTLTWTPAQDGRGVTSYRVFQNGTPLAMLDGAAGTFLVTGLTPGTGYRFTVEARDAAGNRSTNGPAVTVATAPQPDDETAFVTGLYQDVLGRAPEADGLTAWVRALHDGLPRSQAARAVWESAEHR